MEIRLFPLAESKMPLPNEWNTSNNLSLEDWKNNQPLTWINKKGKTQSIKPERWKGIGIVCGKDCPIVFDFDSDFPWRLLDDLFPPTIEQTTPSGGKHLFFQPEGQILESFSQLIPDLDLRATARSGQPGGQAVIYDKSILDDLPDAMPVPDWAFILFPAIQKSELLREFLKNLHQNLITARNMNLYGSFGVPLAAFGMPEETLIQLIRNANTILPNPMDDGEVDQIIENVLNSDAQKTATVGRKTPLANVVEAIAGDHRIHSDARSGLFYFNGKVADMDEASAVIRLKTNFPKAITIEALTYLANENKIDYIAKYLSNLPEWDNNDRIEKIITDIAKDDDFLQTKITLFKKWMMGAFAKRDKRTPGHKLFLVLVGAQNTGKSALLANLVPPHRHTESVSIEAFSGFASKDAWATIDQHLICEFAEMVGNSRKNQNALKNLISSRGVVIRKPYKRSPEPIDPICIFAGTTNEWDTIRDLTGSARFVTVAINNCIPILDMVREERDQIWAQVAYLYENDGSWVSTPEELLIQSQINAGHTRISAPTLLYAEKLREIYERGKLLIRAKDLMFAVCGRDSLTSLERQDLDDAKRAADLSAVPIDICKKIDGKIHHKGRFYRFLGKSPKKPARLYEFIEENPDVVLDLSEGI